MAVKENPGKIDDTTWRAERFLELGFGMDDAWTMAHAKRGNGFLIYWGDVKKYLDNGATHAQIIDWFTYPTEVDTEPEGTSDS